MKQETLEQIENALIFTTDYLDQCRDFAKERFKEAKKKQKTSLEKEREKNFNRLTIELKKTKQAYKDFVRYLKKIEKERKI